MRELRLIGEKIGSRYSIIIDGEQLTLAHKQFKFLCILAAARKAGSRTNLYQDGWIHLRQIEPDGEGQRQSIFLLRQELQLAGHPIMIQSDKHGYYRLELPPENLYFEEKYLSFEEDLWLKEKMRSLRILKGN